MHVEINRLPRSLTLAKNRSPWSFAAHSGTAGSARYNNLRSWKTPLCREARRHVESQPVPSDRRADHPGQPGAAGPVRGGGPVPVFPATLLRRGARRERQQRPGGPRPGNHPARPGGPAERQQRSGGLAPSAHPRAPEARQPAGGQGQGEGHRGSAADQPRSLLRALATARREWHHGQGPAPGPGHSGAQNSAVVRPAARVQRGRGERLGEHSPDDGALDGPRPDGGGHGGVAGGAAAGLWRRARPAPLHLPPERARPGRRQQARPGSARGRPGRDHRPAPGPRADAGRRPRDRAGGAQAATAGTRGAAPSNWRRSVSWPPASPTSCAIRSRRSRCWCRPRARSWPRRACRRRT